MTDIKDDEGPRTYDDIVIGENDEAVFQGLPTEVLEWLKIMDSEITPLLVYVGVIDKIIPAREYVAKADRSS